MGLNKFKKIRYKVLQLLPQYGLQKEWNKIANIESINKLIKNIREIPYYSEFWDSNIFYEIEESYPGILEKYNIFYNLKHVDLIGKDGFIIIIKSHISRLENCNVYFIRNSIIGLMVDCNVSEINDNTRVYNINGKSHIDSVIGNNIKISSIRDSASINQVRDGLIARIMDNAHINSIFEGVKIIELTDNAVIKSHGGDLIKLNGKAHVEYCGGAIVNMTEKSEVSFLETHGRILSISDFGKIYSVDYLGKVDNIGGFAEINYMNGKILVASDYSLIKKLGLNGGITEMKDFAKVKEREVKYQLPPFNERNIGTGYGDEGFYKNYCTDKERENAKEIFNKQKIKQ